MDKKIAIVSKCLLGYKCRYDGEKRDYKPSKILRKRYNIIAVCPEVEIGLPVPREPIRFVKKGKYLILIQKRTGLRVKRWLMRFSADFLSRLKRVDLFILKSRSPSCGNADCKIFRNMRYEDTIGYTDGIFTSVCKRYFPKVPIYNEENIILYLKK